MPCKLCIQRGRPAHYGDDPKCCWPKGEPDEPFTNDNWSCATADKLRDLAGEDGLEPSDERMYVRRDDQSYAALYVPPNPHQLEDEGEFRGGGFIAMTWYKHRGTTDVMVRVDGWQDGKGQTALPLTLAEAEAALANFAAYELLAKGGSE